MNKEREKSDVVRERERERERERTDPFQGRTWILKERGREMDIAKQINLRSMKTTK